VAIRALRTISLAVLLPSCGSGVISSEDVSGGEAGAIAVVIVLALLFVGVIITRK
jgi:hypothetical protein